MTVYIGFGVTLAFAVVGKAVLYLQAKNDEKRVRKGKGEETRQQL